jgi:hypothetical protein
VAGIDESSNWLVEKGPCFGAWKTAFLGTHGEIRKAAIRLPSRLKSNAGFVQFGCAGQSLWQGASSAGTPTYGGMIWSKKPPASSYLLRGIHTSHK